MPSEAGLDRAARLMVEHGVTHLVVLHESGGYPVGILSTLDIISAYGSVPGRQDGEARGRVGP